ncbi:hypothetical protein QR680_005112 [Steinernema hermaphroditum]|uniref:RNase H type-1 domain-containing protein n=1 Tax=Steinernema hermaphroditum TaxID=289476 RepID=A0AA39HQW6_9BILA|nr:hypothetical protein QR680_005112 [Steinernema hermaphroditum]
MQLAGTLASIGFVFGPVCCLKSRSLHAAIMEMDQLPAQTKRPLSQEERRDFLWWWNNVRKRNDKSLSQVVEARRLATDASGTGAGAVLWCTDGATIRTAINFEANERAESSTFREIAAVRFAVKAFANEIRAARVVVQIDNQGAVSIIKKGSPLAKLQAMAEDIFEHMESLGAVLEPIWVPRDQNVLADEASRLLDKDDWGIREEIFAFCTERWGLPSLDAFANSKNAKCPRFLARYADIGAEGVDAFASSWTGEFVWAVPPPRIIADVVSHMAHHRAQGILGIPYWPSNLFFPSVWDGQSWRWFVQDVIWLDAGSELFVPSTFENSVFNEDQAPFPFCFLLVNFAL